MRQKNVVVVGRVYNGLFFFILSVVGHKMTVIFVVVVVVVVAVDYYSNMYNVIAGVSVWPACEMAGCFLLQFIKKKIVS